MGKSIDADELRGRRDERYKEYLESKELAAQMDTQAEQLRLRAQQQWAMVRDRHSSTQELNDLIAVVDPEGIEAKNLARAGQLPVDATTGEEGAVETSEPGSVDSVGDNGSDELGDDSMGVGDLSDESQEVGEGHEQSDGSLGEATEGPIGGSEEPSGEGVGSGGSA